jgi:peptidoglycan/xylan/chitin deacetylase (PgdA/CDA1 family)
VLSDSVVDGVIDWYAPPASAGGPIVLMHDIHQRSVDVTPTILDALLIQGNSFVTVSELLALEGP